MEFLIIVRWIKIKILTYSTIKNISKSTTLFVTLKRVSWKDTFHHFYINDTRSKNWIYIKRVSSRDTFYNSTKSNLY